MKPLRLLLVLPILLSSTLVTPAASQAESDPGPAARALELYMQERFAEARQVMEQIDTAGQADGPLLYRLAYCQRIAGDAPAAAATQQRAKALLEQQVAESDDLEIPFYLVNTYQNLGDTAAMERVAAETTARIEDGLMPAPTAKIGLFQLGKLYADQGNGEKAREWYVKFLDAPQTDPPASASYQRWAGRFLAEQAFTEQRFEAADRYYTMLAETGQVSVADYERLATARARSGRYAEAADAWSQMEKLRPPDANRPRYCKRLAKMAADLGSLPETTPSGGLLTDASKEELEQLMKEQADRVKELMAEAEAQQPLEDELRAEYKAKLREIQPVFVSAALEFALRGHGIRETSFFGGYAPLILRPRSWKLARGKRPPQPPGPPVSE